MWGAVGRFAPKHVCHVVICYHHSCKCCNEYCQGCDAWQLASGDVEIFHSADVSKHKKWQECECALHRKFACDGDKSGDEADGYSAGYQERAVACYGVGEEVGQCAPDDEAIEVP